MRDEGKPLVGAAFSGGGIRGLAHLGVLQVLEKAKVDLDFVAGSSMGGLVAGLYAAGVPLGEIIELAKEMGIMDFASPDRAWRGLFNHDKTTELLVDLLSDEAITFEDLQIPAAVTATDIEAGCMVVLDSGPLIPALVATSALPMLFAPVRHQGRWLVDGGVLNHLPVDVVRQKGADRVLGVNVRCNLTLPLETERDQSHPFSPGRWLPGPQDWRLPFLIADTSLDMVTQVVNRTRLALCPPDLLIEVDLLNVGLLATDQSAEIIANGQKAAMSHVSELVALKTSTSQDAKLRKFLV